MLGVVPLGTGNDMARVMGWGSQFNDEEKLPVILREMEFSSFHLLDRWSIQYSRGDVDMSPITEASTVSEREGRRSWGGVSHHYFILRAIREATELADVITSFCSIQQPPTHLHCINLCSCTYVCSMVLI